MRILLITISLLAVSPIASAQPADAQAGLRFLLNNVANHIDKAIFEDKTCPFELRLYTALAAGPKRERRLVQVVTEAGKSEIYSFDAEKNKLEKVRGFRMLPGNQSIEFQDTSFSFTCAVGMIHLVHNGPLCNASP